jgi:hypothetical protein
MSTFDEGTSSLDEMADATGRDGENRGTGPGLANSDLNSERPDGSGGEGTSATTTGESDGSPSRAATHEDVDRGNADGSTPTAQPREDTLAAAEARAEQEDADQSSALGESGQDNGLNE